MKSFILFLVLVTPLSFLVKATSIKMDFLSMGTVRTDPLMFSQFGNCLSDHVHRFYGATSSRTMRPDATFQDLRSAKGNTGNVEENHSLYWNPAIYKVKNPNGDKTFEIVDVWFASAYLLCLSYRPNTNLPKWTKNENLWFPEIDKSYSNM